MVKLTDWTRPEALARLADWALAGYSDRMLAHEMGVSVRTLRTWMGKNAKLENAVALARERLDAEAERALHRRAVGYLTCETRTTSGGRTDGSEVVTEKFVPPDARALQFWLQNRQPERWKDKGRRDDYAPDVGPDPFVQALKRAAEES